MYLSDQKVQKKVKLLKSSINNNLSNDSYGNIVRSVLTNICWDPTETDSNGKKKLYYTYNACTILERNQDYAAGDWNNNEKVLILAAMESFEDVTNLKFEYNFTI